MATDLQQCPKVLALYGTPADVLEVLRGLGLSHGTQQHQQPVAQPPHEAWPQPECCTQDANANQWRHQAGAGAQASPQQQPQQQACCGQEASTVAAPQCQQGAAASGGPLERAAAEVCAFAGQEPTAEGAHCNRGTTEGTSCSDAGMGSQHGTQFFCIADDADSAQVSPRQGAATPSQEPGPKGAAGTAGIRTGGEGPVLGLRLDCSPEEELPTEEQSVWQVRTPRPHGGSLLEGVLGVRRRADARHTGCEGVQCRFGGTPDTRGTATPDRCEGGDGPATLGIGADFAPGVSADSDGESGPTGSRAGDETGLRKTVSTEAQVNTPPMQRTRSARDDNADSAGCPAEAEAGALSCGALDAGLQEVPPWPDLSTDCSAGVDAGSRDGQLGGGNLVDAQPEDLTGGCGTGSGGGPGAIGDAATELMWEELMWAWSRQQGCRRTLKDCEANINAMTKGTRAWEMEARLLVQLRQFEATARQHVGQLRAAAKSRLKAEGRMGEWKAIEKAMRTSKS